MGYQSRDPGHLNLLLLSGDAAWNTAVTRAAAELGSVELACVTSAADAVDRLAASDQSFSHLLLQPGSAGDLLPALVGLTAGEVGSGVGLILLGGPGSDGSQLAPSRVPIVRDTAEGWLGRVLPLAGQTSPVDPVLSEGELRAALAADCIQTRYQPIVSIADRRPVGLEVLVRLDHPTLGTLPPDLFVPKIEQIGLSWKLTEAVVRRAFEEWDGAALDRLGLVIALNFPLDVLLVQDALLLLEDQRKRARIPANRIVVELTESRPVEQLQALRRSIGRLRDEGYGLAIDDVGPEVRDHRALLDLKFTVLKLDKDLVREAPDSTKSQSFLSRAIASAREAGLTIVAEGVEDAAIWDRMAALGVDQAQGFLIARPLPAAAVAPWHANWCRRFVA